MSNFSIFCILGTWNAFPPPEGTLSWSASVPRSTKHKYLLYVALTYQTKNRKTEIPRTKMDLSMMQNGAVSRTCVVFKKCQPRPSQGVQSEGLQRDDLHCAGWFGHGDAVQQAMLQPRRNGARLPYDEFSYILYIIPILYESLQAIGSERCLSGWGFLGVVFLKGVSLGDIQIDFQPQSTSPSDFLSKPWNNRGDKPWCIWWASQKLCQITWTLWWFLGHGPPRLTSPTRTTHLWHAGMEDCRLAGWALQSVKMQSKKNNKNMLSFLYHTKYLVLYHVNLMYSISLREICPVL